jgi:copper chaperone
MSVTAAYTVTGMTCGHCVQAVTAEVSRIAGVRDVAVDLGSGQVTVTSDEPLETAQVREAVDEAGYELAGVASGPRARPPGRAPAGPGARSNCGSAG